ncbi:MAG: TonB family protein [Acidobacteriota bacterium]
MSKRKKRRRQRRPEGRAGQPTQAVPAEDVSSNVPVDATGSSETVSSEGVLSETVLSEGVLSETVLSEGVSSDDLSTAPDRLSGRGDAGPRHDADPRDETLEEPRFRSYFDLLAEKYPDGESAPRVVGGDRRGEGGKSGDGGGTTGVYPRPLLARRMRRERSGRDYRAIVVAVLGLFAVGVVLAVVLTTTPSRRPELPSRPQERRAEDPAAPARSPVTSPSPDASPANPSSDRSVPGASTPTARDTTAPADTVRAPAAEPPVEVVVVDSDPTIEEFSARFDELDRSAAGGPGAVGDGAAPGGQARGTAAGGSAADDEPVEIPARAELADSLVESDTVPRDRTVIRPRRETSAPRGPPQRGAATRRPATRLAETRSSETPLSDTGLSERQETASAGESSAGELSASEPSAPSSLPDPSPAAERVAVAERPVARTAPAEATRPDDDTDLAAIDQVVAVDDAAAMTQARRVFAPQPRYPEAARQNSEQGTVVLVGTVGVNGVVRDARVLRGRSPALDRAALEAFRTWQFEPAQLGGAAIESTYRVGINFRLDPEREQSAAPLPFGGDFVPPVRLSTPQPEYPAAAWAAGVSGLVVLELVVGIDGRVQGVDVLQGLPNGVTEAAVAAVRTWTFRPASRKGLRVAVRHRVTLRFDPP